MTLVLEKEVSMHLSSEQIVEFFSGVLEKKLLEVTRGEFIQIERMSGGRTLSEVALRFTGNMFHFQRQITAMLRDACEALKDGQTIRIRITD